MLSRASSPPPPLSLLLAYPCPSSLVPSINSSLLFPRFISLYFFFPPVSSLLVPSPLPSFPALMFPLLFPFLVSSLSFLLLSFYLLLRCALPSHSLYSFALLLPLFLSCYIISWFLSSLLVSPLVTHRFGIFHHERKFTTFCVFIKQKE